MGCFTYSGCVAVEADLDVRATINAGLLCWRKANRGVFSLDIHFPRIVLDIVWGCVSLVPILQKNSDPETMFTWKRRILLWRHHLFCRDIWSK